MAVSTFLQLTIGLLLPTIALMWMAPPSFS